MRLALEEHIGVERPGAESFLMDAMEVAAQMLGLPMGMMRYRGAKKSVAAALAKKMKPVKGTYHEPFVGSGSSLLRVGKAGKFEKAIVSDKNPQVTEYLKEIKKDPQGVKESFLRFSEGLIQGDKGESTQRGYSFYKRSLGKA